MLVFGPTMTISHGKPFAQRLAVSSDEVAEWLRDLMRRDIRFPIPDKPGIGQPPNLVTVVHAYTRRNNAPHTVPVEGRQLQPALIPEVDEGVIESDVADHGISSLLPPVASKDHAPGRGARQG